MFSAAVAMLCYHYVRVSPSCFLCALTRERAFLSYFFLMVVHGYLYLLYLLLCSSINIIVAGRSSNESFLIPRGTLGGETVIDGS